MLKKLMLIIARIEDNFDCFMKTINFFNSK